MIWNKFTINTTTIAEDILAANLYEMGVEGVEIEDRVPVTPDETRGVFVDVLPDLGVDEGKARLNFYVEILSKEDKEKRLLELEKTLNDPSIDASYSLNSSNVFTKEELAVLLDDIREMLIRTKEFIDIGEGTIESDFTEDIDWINKWKDFFHSFTVGDLLIKPAWEDVSDKEIGDKTVINMDPGLAFGTGSHETTKLCLLGLLDYLKEGDKVADIGCGSGILGVTALKLGASFVYATDLDEAAVEAVSENAGLNDIKPNDLKLEIANVIDNDKLLDEMGRNSYDIVCANILAPVIVMLTKEVPKLLKKDAIFISSGIVNTRKDEVLEAFNNSADLEVIRVRELGDWVGIVAKRV